MSEIILYHYPLSPFSEKVRLMLGYAGLEWQSVTVKEMPPRPSLETLAGGYRKVPVAQIGADVFCDTRTIAREIARLGNKPELALENNSEEIQAFVKETDLDIFLACLIASSSTKALVKLVKSTSVLTTLKFFKDRISMGRKAKVAPVGPREAKKKMHHHLGRMEGMLDTPYLFGEKPCIADFSAYHSLWYVRDVSEVDLAKRYPKVNAWMNRMHHFGHGKDHYLSEDAALDLAKSAEPRAISEPGSDDTLGTRVSVAPSDYGREPVVGKLVAASQHELVLQREHPRVGTVNVHFPRDGFTLRPGS
ncbi:glutathione S-transferase family protein [Hydrocarboniclastica marina]|uniref:Glutathione S-transferase family protein n=1 Tax=Hydrocarboniclastica marina TaxID=2259620 RepID=A0A4P7XKJ0_9ALTE|nr:glutathione S-transferase family protein [Hydrocarboniclastica marina]MAM00387.1 glutathione S-transferase [Alteromonadaceae bacterium]QCF27651.1 glutathione S-transferase family protein [Hydrocarboniclastica marina]